MCKALSRERGRYVSFVRISCPWPGLDGKFADTFFARRRKLTKLILRGDGRREKTKKRKLFGNCVLVKIENIFSY